MPKIVVSLRSVFFIIERCWAYGNQKIYFATKCTKLNYNDLKASGTL